MSEQKPETVSEVIVGASASTAGLGGNFAPGVMLDGRRVTPTGWMWVLGFALAGCEWAVIAANKPEFRETVANWMRDRKRAEAEQEIAALEQRISSIRASMTPNADVSGAL